MSTRTVLLAFAFVVAPVLAHAQIEFPPPPAPRTFPQFVGTWELDENASTGELRIAPRIARTLTIATTPTELTLTERLRLDPRDTISETPPPLVVRFDGTPSARMEGPYEKETRFVLAADMLVLSAKEKRLGAERFNVFTDAWSVDGDTLTLHRQLVAVVPPGYIATMGHPPNNFRHTYIYRRAKP